MKVVLFCGGFGMRMREHSESIPKPMVTIGYRPILWHVMKYYAHFGHREFILCLGWQANVIKQYFLNYDECISNDFVMSEGGKSVTLLGTDIQDWKITFVDTGSSSNIGQRLKAVERHLDGEEVFLANYTDGLTDVDLPQVIASREKGDAVASFLSVKPRHSFHAIKVDSGGSVTAIAPIEQADVWMNGGYFVFRRDIFDYIHDGEELVDEPFKRLIATGRLQTYKYDGFWSCMDTFKEKQSLDEMYARGEAQWEVWNSNLPTSGRPVFERPLTADYHAPSPGTGFVQTETP